RCRKRAECAAQVLLPPRPIEADLLARGSDAREQPPGLEPETAGGLGRQQRGLVVAPFPQPGGVERDGRDHVGARWLAGSEQGPERPGQLLATLVLEAVDR